MLEGARATDQATVLTPIVEGLELEAKWGFVTEPVRKAWEERHNQDMPLNLRASMGRALESTCGHVAVRREIDSKKVYEAAQQPITEDNFGPDTAGTDRYIFPVIAASLPMLAASNVVSIQPIDRPTADIYYLNYLYDISKYNHAVGDDWINARTGPPYEKHFSDEWDRYSITSAGGVPNGVLTNLTFTTRYAYIYASNFTVYYTIGGTQYSATDNGSGTVVGTHITAGTINTTTGAVDLTFDTAPDNGTSLIVLYKYSIEKNAKVSNDGTGMPKMKYELESVSVTVEDRYLISRWSLKSAYNLQTVFSISADALMQNALVGSINHELDTWIFEYVRDQIISSGAGTLSFSSSNPYTGVNLIQYYDDLIATLAQGDMLIVNQTGAPGANVIVAGTDLCAILNSLPADRFQRNEQPKNSVGPFVLGKLNNRYTVIQNPGYDTDEFVMLYRGDDYLHSAFVFAPYMPFKIVGPQAFADDMKERVGVMTSNALKVINAGFGVYGQVTSS